MSAVETPRPHAMALTVAQVAEILGVAPRRVRFWADIGYLPAVRTPGGQRRFAPGVVSAFAARRRAT